MLMGRWTWTWKVVAAGLVGLVCVAFASPAASPFAGSWAGTYALPDLGSGGTVELTISESGVLKGRSVNEDGTGHTLIGHLKPDGSAVGVALFDDPGAPTEFFSGSCSIDPDGKLLCDLIGCIQGDCFSLLVSVSPQ
ncbi:MAG TPA: hypothetical protein VFD43_02525 [Planctomycetota bacterium]|nr:hypothetical protein [Planctomycetota bacterium]